MDQVIEGNTERLRLILAALVAMAGFAPELRGEPRRTLPRHLRNAVLRLLRPAEAAARRLIVVAAQGLIVTLPPARRRKLGPPANAAALRGLGLAVTLSPAAAARLAADARAAAKRAAARTVPTYVLPLVDPPRRSRSGFAFRRVYVPAHAAPRIACPGFTALHRLPPPPSPGDAVDATRIGLRLQALAAVLDDLPGQARRLARWKARRERASGNRHGNSPLRLGRAPGQILPRSRGRWPAGSEGAARPSHPVHDLLADLHYFAREALRQPDTS